MQTTVIDLFAAGAKVARDLADAFGVMPSRSEILKVMRRLKPDADERTSMREFDLEDLSQMMLEAFPNTIGIRWVVPRGRTADVKTFFEVNNIWA